MLKLEDREYQGRIVSKTIDHFEKGYKHVMIESPTGSGKTVMGNMVLDRLDLPVLWVTMRRNLLKQAQKTVKDMGLDHLDITYSTIFNKDIPKKAVLVVDEAQHDATVSTNYVYKNCKPRFVLGMTATPYRTDKLTLCFEKVVRDIGISQLIRLNHLSQFQHFTIQDWEPETVAKHYIKDQDRFGQSVMFFHKYDQCMTAMKILAKAGVRCDIVTAKTDRDAQLDAFENGELDVLLNMMVLTEGFDFPDLATVFVRDSVKLPTTQMSGRVLRKSDRVTFKKIVQSKNTGYSFTKTANPASSYVWDQNQWLCLQLNENLDRIALETAKLIMQIKSPEIPTKQDKWR